MARAELAADTINGVYICEVTETERGEVLYDWDFHAALGTDFEGTIYGIVTQPDVLAWIESDYGIN